MNGRELIENNKLIAQFMDLVENHTLCNYGSFSLKHDYESTRFTSFIHEQMSDETWHIYPKFRSSWDLLMQVVEKIEQIKTEIITNIEVIIYSKSIQFIVDYNYVFDVGDGGRTSKPLFGKIYGN